MKNKKRISEIFFMALIVVALLIIFPNTVNAKVTHTQTTLGSNGSMEINFKGLTINKSLEYEYSFTKRAAEKSEKWNLVTEYTDTTAKITLSTATKEVKEVIDLVDTGYITIREKESQKVVLEPYAIDLKVPYLQMTSYTVINNGKEFGNPDEIKVPLRCAGNSKAFYQYEKITDQKVIDKFKEIKAKKGDYTQLQSMLKTTAPAANWKNWQYWNGHFESQPGFGYTEKTINVPDEGLYYMWVYFAGDNVKNMYGYILVDNLAPEIPLDSISLVKTAEVEINKTLTLTPKFNPTTTTNKIVKWTSSDETVATVDNAGKITPKKIGSTIITVTSQDGSKKATCTVTVKAASTGNEGQNNNNSNNNNNQGVGGNSNQGASGNNNQGTTSNNQSNKENTSSNNKNDTNKQEKDTTTAPVKKLPQAGANYTVLTVFAAVLVIGIILCIRYKKMKDIN